MQLDWLKETSSSNNGGLAMSLLNRTYPYRRRRVPVTQVTAKPQVMLGDFGVGSRGARRRRWSISKPRRTDADRLWSVVVVVAAMICLGRRRSGVMQLDRLTVRRVEISLAPGFLPLADFGGRCRAL